MGVVDPGGYTISGRIDGSYVYMLLCSEGDAIYIKIGMTCTPTKRLYALVNNCPLKPEIFATANVYSRKMAYAVERALHRKMRHWRQHGEWFRLTPAERAEFNQGWKDVFAKFAKPHWPMYWVQTEVAPVMRRAKLRQRHWLRKNAPPLQID